MDAHVTLLFSFPPHPPPNPPLTDAEYDKQARNFTHSIQKIPLSKLTGSVSGGSLLDVRLPKPSHSCKVLIAAQILNPAINSISYSHVLLAHIIDPSVKGKNAPAIHDAFAPGTPLWQKMLDFMSHFDPVQIRYAGSDVRTIIETTNHKALLAQEPASAINPIRTAILRIDPSGATFTSSHVLLIRLCLYARAYAAPLQVLDSDIYHFPAMTNKGAEAVADSLAPFPCSFHETSSTFINTASGLTRKLDYQDHLEYFLLGAMCYMALKDWDRGMLFLELCLTSPTTNTASRIQVEAYKKYVLVSLLLYGKLVPLPKTANVQTVRMCQNLSKPHTGLAEVFKYGIDKEEPATKLIAEAQEGNKFWQEECNLGLVRQVLDAYRQFSVQRLGKTFAALPIPEISKRTSWDPNDHVETGQYIIKLISAGQLNATISEPSEDPSTWVLRFFSSSNEGPKARSGEQQFDDLQRQVAKVQTLMSHVRETDRKFGLSKEYISEQKRLKKGVGWGEKS
ncbi:uncharacterized protein KY384_002360 [Bacidia gigantensis]|uniref:uncharacterized protein n=1 Tax=Bacidia gigantensis TaxID=2732470 RepID=UPI001D05202C|nr:uncharacterized protein KY384_002360 [Bacidia gigantensis]KAG8532483.1 hypothetical protein KY384_002360 [Bacidia gigantensis]